MTEETVGTGDSSKHTKRSQNDLSAQADAKAIFHHVLACVLPEPALRRCVHLDEAANTLTVAGRTYHLDDYNRILVVGGGKAGRRTGSELVNILGGRITAGVLNVYQEQAREPISGNIELFAANHPTPNEAGVEGARRMVDLLKSADPKTLVIALISGGGSSLMALPVAGISLEDYREISNLLLTIPATIDEINAVRKHLDPLKGGGMRKMAKDAGGFISLVLSDVPVTKTGVVDDPSVISSGPTVGDDSTFRVGEKGPDEPQHLGSSPCRRSRGISKRIWARRTTKPCRKTPPSWLRTEVNTSSSPTTTWPWKRPRKRPNNWDIRCTSSAARPAPWRTRSRRKSTEEIENIWKVISSYLIDHDRVTFASFSTDGVDGHSDLAGAIADQDTLARARDKGLDYRKYLADYDSATFFKKLGFGDQNRPDGHQCGGCEHRPGYQSG